MASSVARIGLACQHCRSKKRRCDGKRPRCSLCTRLDQECIYAVSDSKSKSSKIGRTTSDSTIASGSKSRNSLRNLSASRGENKVGARSPEHQTAVEATSGVLSAHLVTTKIQGADSHAGSTRRPQVTPWNLGVGYGRSSSTQRSDECNADPVQPLASWEEFSWLAQVFFSDVHPIFGTFSASDFWDNAKVRWQHGSNHGECLVPLFGLVAALGALFAHDTSSEAKFFKHADKHLSAHLLRDHVFNRDIDSLVLRTLYLRLTVGPSASWLASCTMITVLQSTIKDTAPRVKSHGQDAHGNHAQEVLDLPELYQKKVLLTARLLNAWICNESGKPRPFDLHVDAGVTNILKSAPQTPSWDLLRLYNMSEVLDPGRIQGSVEVLQGLLLEFCRFEVDHDVIALSKTNLTIVVYRRLRSNASQISNELILRLIQVGVSGLDAAKRLAQHQKPWYHVANVPFQVLCTLLLLDTRDSLSLVGAALGTIKMVADIFNTPATQATLQTATQLVTLAQKRKQEDSADLLSAFEKGAGMADTSQPPMNQASDFVATAGELVGDQSYLSSDSTDRVNNWDEVDWDQLLSGEEYLWNMASQI